MKDYLYLKMLIVGLQDHSKYLSQYLTREQKKAENEFIEFDEFIRRTISVIEAFEGYLRLKYHENKSSHNNPAGNMINDDGIKIEISFTDFTIPISELTNDQFEGEIGYQHTSELRHAINEAFEFYQYEDDSIEFVGYQEAKNLAGSNVRLIDREDNDESENDKHSEIFKNNGYNIWKIIFKNLQIVESSRTDLRFMYEIMMYNELIHTTVTVKNITDWINDTYEFAIDKLPYTNIKSKANKKRLFAFNQVLQANPN